MTDEKNPIDRMSKPCSHTKEDAWEFFKAHYDPVEEMSIKDCYEAFVEAHGGKTKVKLSYHSFAKWARQHGWIAAVRESVTNTLLRQLHPLIPAMSNESISGLQGAMIKKIYDNLEEMRISSISDIHKLLDCVAILNEIRQSSGSVGIKTPGEAPAATGTPSSISRLAELRAKVAQMNTLQ